MTSASPSDGNIGMLRMRLTNSSVFGKRRLLAETIGDSRLQMVRHGIMDPGLDALLSQISSQRFAHVVIFQPDHEHVIDRFGLWRIDRRKDNSLYPGQFAAIPLRDTPPAGVEIVQHLQLFPPHRRLNLVEPKVESDFSCRYLSLRPWLRSMVICGRCGIVGQDRPAVAVNGQIFRRIKTDAA
jgi:hypothetical protein